MSELLQKFKFDLPTGWQDQSVYAFDGPRDGDVRHQLLLTVDRNVQAASIEEFARDRIDPIVNGLEGIEVLKDREITVDGGHPAWELAYKWVPGPSIVQIHKYVFVLHGGFGFTFSIRFTKRTAKTVGLQLKDVIESILPGTYEPLEED